MGRHDQLLSFLSEMSERFPHFSVVAINQREPNRDRLPIKEVKSDRSDNEICLVRSDSTELTKTSLSLDALYSNLRNQIAQNPDYSLMVSDWFRIDDEHTGRVDVPLQSVEVDEDAEEFRLLF
jgi:hypothetical protein